MYKFFWSKAICKNLYLWPLLHVSRLWFKYKVGALLTLYTLTSEFIFSRAVLYTFLKVQTRRICVTIEYFLFGDYFFFFLWPWCMIQRQYSEELLLGVKNLMHIPSKERLDVLPFSSKHFKFSIHFLVRGLPKFSGAVVR